MNQHPDNMDDELINPHEFTEKELLKMVYRDLHRLKTEFEDYKRNNDHNKQIQVLQLEISQINSKLELEKTLREQLDSRNQRVIAIAGFIIVAVQFVIHLLFFGK